MFKMVKACGVIWCHFKNTYFGLKSAHFGNTLEEHVSTLRPFKIKTCSFQNDNPHRV